MFPSVLNTFNRPTPTDRLNSPSHSALHNTVSSALGQVQAVIGTNTGVNASAVGTLMYDVRSPDSDGGGHVQTAVKGGTGQITFTKGDQLVATSPSVLSKVAVGLDGQAWVADSSVAAGIKWGNPGGTKIANAISVMGMTTSGPANGSSLISAQVPGSTLGTTGGIRLTAFVSNFNMSGAGTSVMVRAVYGNTNVASVLLQTAVSGALVGRIEYNLVGTGAVNSQKAILTVASSNIRSSISTVVTPLSTMDTGSATEDSGGVKSFGITGFNSGSANASDGVVILQGYTIEKII